jgi:hypothetical protein
MPIDFSNPGYVSKNGQQSLHNSEHPVYGGVKRSSFLNPKASPQGMEAKLFLTVLSYIGLGSYVAGIFLNLNNWKADLLFLCGLAFMLLKFIRLTIRTWQSYKREEIEQNILKRKSKE